MEGQKEREGNVERLKRERKIKRLTRERDISKTRERERKKVTERPGKVETLKIEIVRERDTQRYKQTNIERKRR